MIVGIFVGGQSSRMGGRPKGLLLAPDSGEPLVLRSARLARSLGFTPVLVGAGHAYRTVVPDLPIVSDERSAQGPLAGLAGLLRFAGTETVLALACDMPYVSAALLSKLAAVQAAADVVAPRSVAGCWEPLCARYQSANVAPILAEALATGVRSFQQLFTRLRVAELELSPDERSELRDWDTPEDTQA